MAEKSCKRLLFFFFLVFSLAICCSGSVLGSSYDSRSKTAISSIVKALSTLKQVKAFPFQFQVLVSDQGLVDSLSNTGGSANIYLKQTMYVYLRSYKAFLVSGSKTHLRSHLPKLEIPSVMVSFSSLGHFSNRNELQMLLPILRSTKSLLRSLHLEKHVKFSVALPLSLLNSLNMKQTRHLVDILHFIRETKSYLIVEESVDGELNKADGLIQSVINKANLVVLFPSPADVVSKLASSRRELLASFNHKSIIRDSLFPPTTSIPTTPVTNPTTPTTIPQYSPTPTIVTIPGTNPVPVTPPSPVPLPYTNPVPSTTPVSITPTTPTTIPVAPVTDPGTQPVTNPVTTYPPPSTIGGVPSTTSPVTTPVTAPATTNAPVIPGQTWCIARSGVVETSLQSALDYACGIGGADCSTIQEGASCYNPNTLGNHASYAFNSYFQKNPVATSCDFGGTAVLVNTNPSSGTCIYPSSATTTAPSTIPPATTASTSGATGTETGSSYGSPPSVLNTGSSPIPGSSTAYGYANPPIITTPPSGLAGEQPFFDFILLTTSLAITVLLGV